MTTRRTHLWKIGRRRRDDRGQAILEFALVLPLLAAIVLIFVSFGKALYYYIELTQVADEGARQAAVNQPGSGFTGLKTVLCDQFGSGSELYTGSGTVTAAKIAVSYPDTGSATPQAVGEPVKVVVSTQYSWFPFMNLGTFTISGSATMRLEQATGANYTQQSGSC